MRSDLVREFSNLRHKRLRLLLATMGRLLNFLLTTIPSIWIYNNYNLKGYEYHLAGIACVITIFISYYILGFWQFLTTKYWVYYE